MDYQPKQKQMLTFISLKDDKNLFHKVHPHLIKLADKQYRTKEIVDLLKQFEQLTKVERSFSRGKRDKSSYQYLYEYEEELKQIYSKIARYVLETDPVPVELMLRFNKAEQAIRKADVILILCLMSLCLVPVQEYQRNSQREDRFTHIKNFSFIFSNVKVKTDSILTYLSKEASVLDHDRKITGKSVMIKRLVASEFRSPFDIQNLIKGSQKKMCELFVEEDNKDIQDFYGQIKVDFANKYIGGGSLTFGCVQEEIMFIVHPELYVTMLLCERMQGNEAIQMIGFQKYFSSEGYGDKVSIKGLNKHQYKYQKLKDGSEICEEYITAIDAINFNRINQSQYAKKSILREILKCYAGLMDGSEGRVVVSGNWGCGVFGGDLQLKMIIQWIACTLAGKDFRYVPFGKRKIIYDEDLLDLMKGRSVKDVYLNMIQAANDYENGPNKNGKRNNGSIYSRLFNLIK